MLESSKREEDELDSSDRRALRVDPPSRVECFEVPLDDETLFRSWRLDDDSADEPFLL